MGRTALWSPHSFRPNGEPHDRAWLAEHMTRGATEREWAEAADVIRPFRPHEGTVAIVNELDAACCRQFVRDLQKIETNREPLEQILRRTYIRRAHHSNWQSRAGQVINELADDTSDEDYLRRSYKLSQVDLRRVIVVAAVRAFTLEHGKLPDQLQNLVPEYLDTIPSDPFDKNSKPIQYELTEEGFRLTNEPADSQAWTRKPMWVWVPPEFRP